jgi:hypothetical protein
MWKIFFESDEIMKQMNLGLTPTPPPIFSADALLLLFSNKGVFYGVLGMIFFLIPVCTSNYVTFFRQDSWSKLTVKAVHIIEWTVGLLLVDVIVAFFVSKNTIDVKNLLNGGGNAWQWWEAMKTLDFWLVFIFGSFPLLITKGLISMISDAIHNSSLRLIDKAKAHKLACIEKNIAAIQNNIELIDFDIQRIEATIANIEEQISDSMKQLADIQSVFDSSLVKINEEAELEKAALETAHLSDVKELESIYMNYVNAFEANDNTLVGRLSEPLIVRFKAGFYGFISSYFSETESKRRINELEQISIN